MVLGDYLDEEEGIFNINDNPIGFHIFYSMSLSAEEPLHKSVIGVENGEEKVSLMFNRVENVFPFSRGAMNELMYAA